MAAHQPTMTGRVPDRRSRARKPGRLRPAALALAGALACSLLPARGFDATTGAQRMRIVSLVPSITEALFAIGAGPEVVAVSSYDTYPPEVASKPRVGALIDPDIERILSLRPTLAMIYATQRDLAAQLEHAGIDTFTHKHGGLADIVAMVRAVGARVGRTDQANTLAAHIERTIEATRARVAGRPAPRTLLVFSREPGALRSVYASGGVGFLHDLLDAAGARNVFADVPRESVQATLEQLIARAPEVIIEVRVGADAAAARAAVADWQQLSSAPAVRQHRVHVWTEPNLVVPGPRVADALVQLAELLRLRASGFGGPGQPKPKPQAPGPRSLISSPRY